MQDITEGTIPNRQERHIHSISTGARNYVYLK